MDGERPAVSAFLQFTERARETIQQTQKTANEVATWKVRDWKTLGDHDR
jgi:hypothetical protein